MLALVVLAAGKGTRMRAEIPKVLHPLLGMTLLEYAFEKAEGLRADRLAVVIGYGRDAIRSAYAERDIIWAVQEEQLGTGHAASVGLEALGADSADADVMVLNGDLPLLRVETLHRMVEVHRTRNANVTVLTARKSDPTGFGRIVRAEPEGEDAEGELIGIVEETDADQATRALREVNAGTYIFRADTFREFFARVGTRNRQGELYLTDVVVEAAHGGARVETVEAVDELETEQVNSQKDLARVSAILRQWLLDEYLEAGVRIDDPATAYIEKGVRIAPGARIHPFCVIRRGVEIGPGCEVGPFATLRPGTQLDDGAKVGNFVEVKNSHLGPGTKAGHLAYIGDADVGADVNVGAGTVFANFDGERKHRTVVKDRAFLGSGSVLVAPVTIGAGSVTGAGAVVLRGRDVPDGEVVVGVPARRIAPGTHRAPERPAR